MDVDIGVLEASDWPDIAAIYAQGIETGDATFETAAPDWSEWDSTHRDDCRLVARVDGEIAGWAALSSVSDRCVYDGVAETSIRGVRDAGAGRGGRIAATSRGGIRGGRHLDVAGRRVSGERTQRQAPSVAGVPDRRGARTPRAQPRDVERRPPPGAAKRRRRDSIEADGASTTPGGAAPPTRSGVPGVRARVGLPSVAEPRLGQDESRPGGIVAQLLAKLANEHFCVRASDS